MLMPRQDYFDWLESVNQCGGSDSDSVILLFVFLPLIRAEIFRWVDIHNEHKWAPLNFAPIFTFKNEWTCVILLVRSLIMESRFHAFPGREQEIYDQLLVGARKETPDVWLCRAPPAQKKINGRVTYRHEWGWISDICAPMDAKGSTLLISLCWYPSELEDTPVELQRKVSAGDLTRQAPWFPPVQSRSSISRLLCPTQVTLKHGREQKKVRRTSHSLCQLTTNKNHPSDRGAAK